MRTGIDLITEERNRQIQKEGFSEKHDLAYKNNELEDYAMFLLTGNEDYFPNGWDIEWKEKRFKRSRRENIIKAAALLAAHLDATKVKMKKFLLNTTSESGDNYTYFINHTKKPSDKEIHAFLMVNATDKDDDNLYENVALIQEIIETDFLTIPTK